MEIIIFLSGILTGSLATLIIHTNNKCDSNYGLRLDEGKVQRGNGRSGPAGPKPKIVPYGQGYQPIKAEVILPPPRKP